jgi:uncharacterized OB-fold protein
MVENLCQSIFSHVCEGANYLCVKFDGAVGGLVHKLGEVKPSEVRIGMAVEAVFKPQAERKGDK